MATETTTDPGDRPESPDEPLLDRLHRSLGPVTGGLVLDFLDLATLGPVGIFLGPVVGFAAGYWMASIYRFHGTTRVLFAVACGLYMMAPMTEAFPIVTLISAIARFRKGA